MPTNQNCILMQLFLPPTIVDDHDFKIYPKMKNCTYRSSVYAELCKKAKAIIVLPFLLILQLPIQDYANNYVLNFPQGHLI